jgi:superfamily II DNA helicase RecQ
MKQGKYEIVVTNPEILMTSQELRVLWNTPSFTRRLLGFIFNEAHCIVQWGHFRKQYLTVGAIQCLISDPLPVYIASATLPPPLITEIRKLLHMNTQNTDEILCSNNRPDIALMVRQLASPVSSYEDLAFLIPYNWDIGMDRPKKFLVFFDDIKEAEEAKKYFHRRLHQEHHKRIAWFHSTMSQRYLQFRVLVKPDG